MEFSLKEVALRLQMPIETLYRWIRQGKIPMQRNQGEYVIREEMLERWADEHQLKVYCPLPTAAESDGETRSDLVLPAMQRGGFFYQVEGTSKEYVLQAAVKCLPNVDSIKQELIYTKLLEREKMASTGIGHGIALPHPRANPATGLSLPQITTCFLAAPIEFDAIDHLPVSVVMVLLSCSTQQHLSLLSKLSYFLHDHQFRDFLLSAPPAEALLGKVASMEA